MTRLSPTLSIVTAILSIDLTGCGPSNPCDAVCNCVGNAGGSEAARVCNTQCNMELRRLPPAQQQGACLAELDDRGFGFCGSTCSGFAITDPGPGPGGNLITNGGAESAPGSTDGSEVNTPGWTSSGGATAIQYGASGFPDASVSRPPDAGGSFFGGGVVSALSTLSQTVDVSRFAGAIDGGGVTHTLSVWLGGYSDQGDDASIYAAFLGAAGDEIGLVVLGPVGPADRGGVTAFLERSTTGAVPPGTRSVAVTLRFERRSGEDNDGYADSVSLVFDGT